MSRVQRIVIRDDREITRVVNVGPKGAPGTGLRVDGVLSSTSQLPGGAATGDAYLVSGDLWVWSGTAWVNAGPVQGPKGDPGSDFLALGDTPSSYAGRAGDLPVVNAAEDALEFKELGAAAKTMKVKTAAQLADTDYLLGHDAGSPAGMRTLLSSLTEFMTGKIESNANGSYVRMENGLQVCWGSVTVAYNNAQSLRDTWTYPAAFSATPIVLFGGMPASAGAYVGLNLASMGSPIFVTGPALSSSAIYLWDNASPYSPGQSVTIKLAAIGRWK